LTPLLGKNNNVKEFFFLIFSVAMSSLFFIRVLFS
jgi:hypothetical protein